MAYPGSYYSSSGGARLENLATIASGDSLMGENA